jgi:hypothetical protein
MNAPNGTVLTIGQRWIERDNRNPREVEIAGFDEAKGKVQIKGETGKLTWAKLERFSGKSGGYRLKEADSTPIEPALIETDPTAL